MRFLLLLPLLLFLHQEEPLDTIIRNASVYDGSGGPARAVDVGLRGDRIARVGDLAGAAGKNVIDARGLVLCPGFIDLHTHSDQPILLPETRANRNYLLQGCTLVVTGNCGSGHVDVAAYWEKLAAGGAGSNVAHLVPHGAVREAVMGTANRAPTAEELQRMRDLVEKALRDGAFGISTGLIYVPGTYARTDELVELARVVARHGGFYASHIRNESEQLVEAVDEAIRIGREAGCPVHLSHLKAGGQKNWGKVRAAAERVEAARASGTRVTADQYPYTASSTSLAANLVPAEARAGGDREMLARLDDPAVRAAIEDGVTKRRSPDQIMIASFGADPTYNGKTLAQLAAAQNRLATEVAIDILKRGGASGIFFSMSEEDVRWVMQQPWVATASDGSARIPDESHPHPRGYGTFPRKIGGYAVEQKVLPLAQAIHSATGLPAQVMGLPDRGRLREGYYADLAVFDPKTFRDRATFADPHQYAAGLRYLWVNGTLTVDSGNYTGALAGRAVRKSAEEQRSRGAGGQGSRGDRKREEAGPDLPCSSAPLLPGHLPCPGGSSPIQRSSAGSMASW
jgi:N-acyl-D-aspartate/D-glutamate deacylase